MVLEVVEKVEEVAEKVMVVVEEVEGRLIQLTNEGNREALEV